MITVAGKAATNNIYMVLSNLLLRSKIVVFGAATSILTTSRLKSCDACFQCDELDVGDTKAYIV